MLWQEASATTARSWAMDIMTIFREVVPISGPSATSQAIDLTTFFPAGSNWDLDSLFAVTVNNRGEIVGSGLFTDGTVHNFVLVPVHGH